MILLTENEKNYIASVINTLMDIIGDEGYEDPDDAAHATNAIDMLQTKPSIDLDELIACLYFGEDWLICSNEWEEPEEPNLEYWNGNQEAMEESEEYRTWSQYHRIRNQLDALKKLKEGGV